MLTINKTQVIQNSKLIQWFYSTVAIEIYMLIFKAPVNFRFHENIH